MVAISRLHDLTTSRGRTPQGPTLYYEPCPYVTFLAAGQVAR
jgi:hypothetical protein